MRNTSPFTPLKGRAQRARLIFRILPFLITLTLTSCDSASTSTMPDNPHPPSCSTNDSHWREQLTPEQYHITREKGTERAFTGDYWDHKEAGTYKCVCCGSPLFSSETKYASGTGWPSFYKPVEQENVNEEEDNSLAMDRTEVLCSQCNAHLGHVFPDGPEPTGQRYCINSAALSFEKEEKELKP